jgi:hypothetical protein
MIYKHATEILLLLILAAIALYLGAHLGEWVYYQLVAYFQHAPVTSPHNPHDPAGAAARILVAAGLAFGLLATITRERT